MEHILQDDYVKTQMPKRLQYLTDNKGKYPVQSEYCLSLPKGSKHPRMRKSVRSIVCFSVLMDHAQEVAKQYLSTYKPYAYTVVCDESNNPKLGANNELNVDIYYGPVGTT